jgi:hypothetical protein
MDELHRTAEQPALCAFVSSSQIFWARRADLPLAGDASVPDYGDDQVAPPHSFAQ